MSITLDSRVVVFWDTCAYLAVDIDNYLLVQGKTADKAFDKWKRNACACVVLAEKYNKEDYPNHITPLTDPDPPKTPKYLVEMWPETGHYPLEVLEYGDYIFNVIRADVERTT